MCSVTEDPGRNKSQFLKTQIYYSLVSRTVVLQSEETICVANDILKEYGM